MSAAEEQVIGQCPVMHGANTAGLRPPARRDRVLARAEHVENLRRQAAMFDALADRLASSGHAAPSGRLRSKSEVLRRRAALPEARWRRVVGVAGLTVDRGYARYGQGWSSAARDLLWR